ncbi:MAG TPA: LUD domain-containing protein [Pirellulales bacterium]|jgi:L-lactate dehydrogenase complex protein LldG|nr:LUD domain-containing protein [Pirellulales bacterium]
MTSREKILTAIRSRALAAQELPSLEQPWITYADPVAQFAGVLEGIGGRFVRVEQIDQVNRRLDELPVYRDARQTVSLVAGVGQTNIDWAGIDDPHALETVDFAILPGEFGVAENGAIWLTDRGLRHRVLPFIVQHLALVIPARSIVHNMHQAYERLRLGGAEFGVFIAGPSKTADIEQSLVIGAHGPRSLTVFCLDLVD